MARPKNPVPKYTLHKSSGQARIWLDGREVYLGVYNSEQSLREYARIVAELTTGATPEQALAEPDNPTIDEVLLGFWFFARQHYRRADGTPTDQLVEFKNTLKPLRKLYGHVPAKDFGPLALKSVRKLFIDAGNCRTLINSRVGKIRRVFRWAASEQLVPVAVFTALQTVAGLQAGRTGTRESEPVGPVDPAHVRATLPYLNRQVAGLVQFQWLTGCRPGEACALRRCDIDITDAVWLYRPKQHKTRHKGKTRTIAIGPQAQAVLREFFTDDPTAYLFDPRKAVAESRADRAANRKTPLYPSSVKRNTKCRVRDPKRKASSRYRRQPYQTAIRRAVDAANRAFVEAAVDVELHVPHWAPNQLRHLHATDVRKRFGLESAGAALGHSQMSATQIYAERDATLATRVAAEMG